jgi:hypothetical protein
MTAPGLPSQQEGISIMTSESAAAERAALTITDLGELAGRIDVMLANPWIDHAGFLRDTAAGLGRAAQVLPAGPDRAQLADLARDIREALDNPQTGREACLRGTRETLGGMAESVAAALRAAADRAAWVAGLRDLADFLAGHPDVPVPPVYHTQGITVFPEDGTDEERRAEVDRAAGVLGVQAAESGGGHYLAVRTFGPAQYTAVMIPSAGRAADGAAAELAGVSS